MAFDNGFNLMEFNEKLAEIPDVVRESIAKEALMQNKNNFTPNKKDGRNNFELLLDLVLDGNDSLVKKGSWLDGEIQRQLKNRNSKKI